MSARARSDLVHVSGRARPLRVNESASAHALRLHESGGLPRASESGSDYHHHGCDGRLRSFRGYVSAHEQFLSPPNGCVRATAEPVGSAHESDRGTTLRGNGYVSGSDPREHHQ